MLMHSSLPIIYLNRSNKLMDYLRSFMLTIYSSRTHSYHLMANWLKDHQMPYRERIFTPKQPLTRKEIFYLLSLTENGFDDLLAKRSIDYKI